MQAIIHERPVTPTRVLATLNFDSEHCSSAVNQYSLQNVAWSLSDGDLPGIRSKEDFVVAWLDQQNTPAMTDINGHLLWDESNDCLDQVEQQHIHQRQPSPFGFQLTTDCDAQPEPRQVRYRECQTSNEIKLGSSSLLQHPSSAHQRLAPSGHHHQHRSPHPPHIYARDPYHHRLSHPHQSYQHHPHHPQHYLYEQNHAGSIEHHNSIDHHHMYYTHRHYNGSLSHASQELQRSLSLTRAEELSSHLQTDSPQPTASRFEDLSPAEQVRQGHYWYRQCHQIHNQQMQLRRQQQYHHHRSVYNQHWHHSYQYRHKPVTHSHPCHFNQKRQVTNLFIPSAHELDRYPSTHRAVKALSVQDLAWERHCYYQQLQLHEEAIAEQKRVEAQRQQQQQGRLSVPEQDLVSRTGSLNRITSSSLSPQTAQTLGLSRSKSASTVEPWREDVIRKHQKVRQPSSGEPGSSKSIIADCPILSAGRRLIRRNGIKATSDIGQQSPATTSEAPDLTSDSPKPSTPSQHQQRPETSLSRKKTLRDLAPSIRSLARRCSSRFSSRPNSFAGSSSDPVLEYSEEKITVGSLSLKTSHMSPPSSSNRAQLLTPGPDGAIDLEIDPQSEATATVSITNDHLPSVSTPSPSPDTAPERTPIHRKVTLFRSKTTNHSRARNTSPNYNIPETETSNMDTSATRRKSLTFPQRRSLRLANGRGLDLTMFSPNTTTTTTDSTIMSSASQNTEKSASELDKALCIDAQGAEEDPQEAARHQVATILAMGRKDRVSARTGQVMTHSTHSQSGTHLSPLAVETQQDMPLDSSTSEQGLSVKEDPCERIAFMLVPKSRYEFQPLVVM
ncbi:hypothetical protein BG011_000132 [Mortierella polycephala]|uniref:Uncharacterized protein n=1 Tax=Mortierella polycephala TaxID=41804 RepID=A0A9P6TVV0_9FUNG|nr:hypothetical protein BG011_000132 [Mortierella polycephala]